MNKRVSILSLILLTASLSVVSCAKTNNDVTSEKPTSSVRPFSIYDEYIEPELPSSTGQVVNESEVDLGEYNFHSAAQEAYLQSSYDKISTFAKGNKGLDKPNPLSFKIPTDASSFILYEDTSKAKADMEIKEEGNDKYAELINLKADTSYTLEFNDPNKSKVEFKTDNCLPRNIDIDGVKNVRDLGGYPSKLGGKIRQGLYYRGGRFNYTDETTTIDEPSYFQNELTDIGYNTAVNVLGLKSQIDLRMNETHYQTTYAHEYGMMDNDSYPDIEYVPFPLNWNKSNMMKDEKETIGEIFKFLSHQENYPVYVHCNIGTDRTGMITYLLGTLLGIDQLDLYYDYLFSNFANIGGSRDLTKITTIYQKTLLEYKDINLYYDVRDYLNDCGVSDMELDRILHIFIEM